jgi:hypothetical protein
VSDDEHGPDGPGPLMIFAVVMGVVLVVLAVVTLVQLREASCGASW